MMMSPNPYRGFPFPPAVIEHAVWFYHCFRLSLRDVELILAARGIVVSYESIREWSLRFGRIFANALKRRRPQLGRTLLSYDWKPLISFAAGGVGLSTWWE